MQKVEKPAFDLLEKLGGLRPENLNWVQQRHLPSTFLTIFTRFSGSKGLVTQPVAPAALARAFMSASDSVVRKMIGTPVWAGDWRSASIISRPFMFGMLRSVTMRS